MAAPGDDGGALEDALRRLQAKAYEALKPMATSMGQVGERMIKLELSRSSHSAGTPTPSKPYVDPPSLISGSLRDSVRQTRTYTSGPDQWTVHIAPTIVYARIHELGGITGWHYHTHLPPRPYVRPALEKSLEPARKAAIDKFREITGI